MRKDEKRRRKIRYYGFSLIEMTVVMAIIGFLAAIGAGVAYNRLEKAKQETARSRIQLFEQAIISFQIDTGRLPKSLDELIKNPGDKKWTGPYLDRCEEIPKDPWQGEYIYIVPGTHGDFDIISYGKDKLQGGDGFKMDIGNWIEKE